MQPAQLKQKTNAQNMAYPRQIACTHQRVTHCSLPEIGRMFGGKHHTTVLHSVQKIATAPEECRFDRLIHNVIDSIMSLIKFPQYVVL